MHFQYTSPDSLSRLTVFLWTVGLAGMVLPGLLFNSLTVLLLVVGTWVGIAVGLRSTISVTPDEVTIVKRWFFLPYFKISAPYIDDVSYDGDYGLEEGASGVVVTINGKDVCIGSRQTMRYLHDTLCELARGRGRG